MTTLACSEEVQADSQNTFSAVLKWLDENFEKPFLFTGMLSIILIITFQTFYRYVGTHFTVSSDGSVWTEELARFIFIWISYLAIPLAIKKRNNIRVDIIHDRLSPRFQGISWVVVDLCFMALVSIVFWMGLDNLKMLQLYPQLAPGTGMPYMIPYIILPVGFGLMGLRLLQDLTKQVRQCGLVDSLIGVAFCIVIALPAYFSEGASAIAILFGYFLLFLVIGVPIRSVLASLQLPRLLMPAPCPSSTSPR